MGISKRGTAADPPDPGFQGEHQHPVNAKFKLTRIKTSVCPHPVASLLAPASYLCAHRDINILSLTANHHASFPLKCNVGDKKVQTGCTYLHQKFSRNYMCFILIHLKLVKMFTSHEVLGKAHKSMNIPAMHAYPKPLYFLISLPYICIFKCYLFKWDKIPGKTSA